MVVNKDNIGPKLPCMKYYYSEHESECHLCLNMLLASLEKNIRVIDLQDWERFLVLQQRVSSQEQKIIKLEREVARLERNNGKIGAIELIQMDIDKQLSKVRKLKGERNG